MRKSNYGVYVTLAFAVVWIGFMAWMYDTSLGVKQFFSAVIAALYLLCLGSFARADRRRRMLEAMEATARNTAPRRS